MNMKRETTGMALHVYLDNGLSNFPQTCQFILQIH